jgi:hypothetical protein
LPVRGGGMINLLSRTNHMNQYFVVVVATLRLCTPIYNAPC